MKKALSLGLLLFGCLFSGLSMAQEVASTSINPFEKSNPKEFKLVKYTAKLSTCKVYINWLIISPREPNFYLLERSCNGKEFEPINMKEGHVSPEAIEILYSYVDSHPVKGKSVYRLSVFKNAGGELIDTYTNEITNSDPGSQCSRSDLSYSSR